MIGKIQRVPIRDVWSHEAHDFTRWLTDNLDVLNDVLDFSLTQGQREQAAGDFSVDLVARDEEGNQVIIENQFGRSDHDHLGKLITYAAAFDAKKAVWVVGEARPEHIQALTMLNETKTTAYYMVKLEGIKIGESAPAALFTLIVGPSEEGREVGEIKKDLAETEIARKRFWAQLLAEAKKVTQLHANISPGINHWVSASGGKRGLGFNYLILKNEAAVELYIDGGKQSDAENKKLFDKLAESKAKINAAFGEPLDWQRLDEKRACRIRTKVIKGGLANEVDWPRIQKTMISTMARFESVLRPYIKNL